MGRSGRASGKGRERSAKGSDRGRRRGRTEERRKQSERVSKALSDSEDFEPDDAEDDGALSSRDTWSSLIPTDLREPPREPRGGPLESSPIPHSPAESDELDGDDLSDPFDEPEEDDAELKRRLGLDLASSTDDPDSDEPEVRESSRRPAAPRRAKSSRRLRGVSGRKGSARSRPTTKERRATRSSRRVAALEDDGGRSGRSSGTTRAPKTRARSKPKADAAESSGRTRRPTATTRARAKPPRLPPSSSSGESLPPSSSSSDAVVEESFDRVDPAALRAAREVIAENREACSLCSYRKICVYAPASLESDVRSKRRKLHPHVQTLRSAVGKLEDASRGWRIGLVKMLAGREKDALLAGCLLAIGCEDDPEFMRRLLEHADDQYSKILDKSGTVAAPPRKIRPGDDAPPPLAMAPEALAGRMLRAQSIRAAAIVRERETIAKVRDRVRLEADEEGRLGAYEAAALLKMLLFDNKPTAAWVEECEARDREIFLSTFAVRDNSLPPKRSAPEEEAAQKKKAKTKAKGATSSDDDESSGDGADEGAVAADYDPETLAADVVFPYTRGRRRTYLYLRRQANGYSRVTSIDKIRVDSLLKRIFLIFASDEAKTTRVFKEVCRHINVRAGKYSADQVLDGFDSLDREELLVLGLYAPSLARAVGAYLEIDGFDEIVKFLYRARAESGRRGGDKIPAHQKVFETREELETLRERLGDDVIKDFFKIIFRLNASYVAAPHTANTYYKLGEVAYLMTVVAGWNSKGLELTLRDTKPLGFIAYGMQPKSKAPEHRWRQLKRSRVRHKDRDDVQAAIDIGMRYMAIIHGCDDADEFEDEMADRMGGAGRRRRGSESEGSEDGRGARRSRDASSSDDAETPAKKAAAKAASKTAASKPKAPAKKVDLRASEPASNKPPSAKDRARAAAAKRKASATARRRPSSSDELDSASDD